MEGLNVAMKSACDQGIFIGIKLPHGRPLISHLFYVDDAVFIGEWSKANITNLARILNCFHASSGLKVNFNKLRMFDIGASPGETSIWANILGCEVGKFPVKYFYVPIGANMNLKRN